MEGTVKIVYFSPTHSGRDYAEAIGEVISEKAQMDCAQIDLTLPFMRNLNYGFGADDVLVFAFPVYGGRIPVLLEDVILKMRGSNTPVILAAVYGNRAYEDALLEAADRMEERGFCVLAAGAFLGEHSYTKKLAGGRPDRQDLLDARTFAEKAACKYISGDRSRPELGGNRPYKERRPGMTSVPAVSKDCTGCMLCAQSCPMGIIDKKDPAVVTSGCIHCCACIKVCPAKARYFDDEQMKQMTALLEANFTDRKEAEYFV